MNKTRLKLLQKAVNYRTFCQKAAKEKLSVKKLPSATKTFGQPTYETHPYLLKQNEVTPLITRSEFQERRQKLMELITNYVRERNPDVKQHLVIIPSSSKKYMTEKIPYVFRQNSDFLYFSGCQEPDSCLVLNLSNDSTQHKSILFVREKDEHAELWDGPRTGPEVAKGFFGVDQSLSTNELENFLQLHLKTHKNCSLWYDFMNPPQMEVQKIMSDCLMSINRKTWESPKIFMHKLRLIKSQSEIALMQKSCSIASEAIATTINRSKPLMNEHEIFATVDYECRIRGAEFLAYPPVVAGGNRANIIHYINNNQVVKDGELVLMDAGCECHGYSSDITRTWPINGRFTSEQRELYEIVLKVQKDLINLCANFPTLDELFESMCILLGKELQKIGLISKSLSSQPLIRASHQFCPHHVAHYLGMDVHDTGLITRTINIKPGMIITVEPGIYISDKNTQVPREFRGLGIRIEDDVLITEGGPVVLTKSCPKEVEDVENVCRRQYS